MCCVGRNIWNSRGLDGFGRGTGRTSLNCSCWLLWHWCLCVCFSNSTHRLRLRSWSNWRSLYCVAVSFVLSLPTLRLNDDYFVIGTFAFQMILFSVLNNWTSVTRGSLGIRGIPSPTIFGCNIDTSTEFLILTCCCLLFVLFAVYRITSSPFGRVLHAIREDEVFAKAHGKNTLYFKVATLLSALRWQLWRAAFMHIISLTLIQRVSRLWNPS